MNDMKQATNDTNSLGPLIGFALGALVGGGLALLFAPASGERTRQRLGAAARRMSRDARHTFDDARDRASGFGADVKSAIEAGREAFEHDSEPTAPRPASRIVPMGAAPPTTRTT
jgi:gas vesicle protein